MEDKDLEVNEVPLVRGMSIEDMQKDLDENWSEIWVEAWRGLLECVENPANGNG